VGLPRRSQANDATFGRSSVPRARRRPDAASKTGGPWKAADCGGSRGDPAPGVSRRDIRERSCCGGLLDEIDSAVHGPDRRHDSEDPGAFSGEAFTCRAGGAFERAPGRRLATRHRVAARQGHVDALARGRVGRPPRPVPRLAGRTAGREALAKAQAIEAGDEPTACAGATCASSRLKRITHRHTRHFASPRTPYATYPGQRFDDAKRSVGAKMESGARKTVPLEILSAAEAHKRPSAHVVVRGAPAFAGSSDTDYVCGQCHAVICAGVRDGAFAGLVFQCSCGQFNRVPSLG
jgi:hypothetical protein